MEEVIDIKKFISAGGTTLEIGDFYGYGGEADEVITSMEEIGRSLKIYTNLRHYDIQLQMGDWLKMSDDSSKLVKSKYDKFDE